MTEFPQFAEAQVSGQPNISGVLVALLTAATVHKSLLHGFRAYGIATCGRFASIADDVADLRKALSEMFNADEKHSPLHRLEASKLVEVWSQAKARTEETQQKVDSTARHARRAPSQIMGQPHKNFPVQVRRHHPSQIVASSVFL